LVNLFLLDMPACSVPFSEGWWKISSRTFIANRFSVYFYKQQGKLLQNYALCLRRVQVLAWLKKN